MSETTGRTCDEDRYEYMGAIHQRVAGIWFRIENNTILDRDQYRHDLESRVKPRPAAQDADKCRMAFEDYYRPAHQIGVSAPPIDSKEYRLFRFGWNRRLSRLMSAEVEKAIYTVSEYMKTTRDWYEQGHAELGDYMPPLESEGEVAFNALDLIVSALKEKI
jgi:hypothetical protein